MKPPRTEPSRVQRALTLLVAPSAIGWLASGTCTYSACYEECDPCYQLCKCSNVCQNLVAGENGLAIVVHRTRLAEASRERIVRQIEVVVGPTLEFAPDGGSTRIADFARRVLETNSDLFTAQRAPKWSLIAVHTFKDSTAVAFELEPSASGSSNSVTLSFDEKGRLLEVAHAVDRASS